MQPVATVPSEHASASASRGPSRAPVYIGRALSAVAIAFLAVDALGKLLRVQQVVEGSAELGFPPDLVLVLGVVLLSSVVLYAVPRTAVLGAVLLTGYLGGAVAIHVRAGNPLFTHTLFPVYVGLFVWGGLFLRDPLVRVLLPLRRAG